MGLNISYFGTFGNLLCPLQHFCMMIVLDFYICSVLQCAFNQISANVEGLFYCVGTVFSSVMNQE